MRRILLLALLLIPLAARADEGWNPRPGARISLATTLRDEAGRPVALGQLFSGTPVILDLGYYKCPSLCGLARADLMRALAGGSLRPGRDYDLVVLSIDPAETAADAAEAKRSDLARAPGSTGNGWHYLTGTAAAIADVEQGVGFRARYDSRFRQFIHPSGLIVLTGGGVVSGYLFGVGYQPADLRAALERASLGAVSRAASPILLLCFHYDAADGRYTLSIEKTLRVMGVLTILTIGGVLLALHVARPS